MITRLSAPHSPFVKRVLPFLTVVAVSAWTYQSTRHQPYALEMTAAMGAIGLIILWVILKRDFWRMADIVEDHGDRLVVTRWRTRVEIPLANVKKVVRVPTVRGGTVTLELKTPSALGSEIAFLVPDWRTMRDIDEKLSSLERRVAGRS